MAYRYRVIIEATVNILVAPDPGLGVTPESVGFGDTPRTEQAIMPVDVANIGDQPVSGVEVSSSDLPDDVSLLSTGSGPIQPGESIPMQLWLQVGPNAPLGPASFAIKFAGS